jgi:HAD superfamily hydrolase (TIGR01450 family)
MTFKEWRARNKTALRAILFDIDGTLVAGRRLLPGADELLAELRDQHFPFFLLTNDGNHSTEEKSSLMARAGLHVSPEEIVSCSMALEEFAEENNCLWKTFFVMGDLGNPCYAERANLKVCRDVQKINECDGVIVGEGFYNWHDNIQAVFNYLIRNPERPLVVPNPDSYWPSGKNGEFGIGAGGKARFICGILEEMGIKIAPVYLGKPYPLIYEYTVHVMKKRFGITDAIDYKEILMIGDSLNSDIRGANWLGMSSGLVMTGITTEQQVANAKNEFKPDFIFSSLA